MAALSEDVKRFVVESLACFDSPTRVSECVKEEFGLVVPRQQVELYDPTKAAGKSLSKKWRAVFDATRKKFHEDAAGEVAISKKLYRLRAIQRMALRAETMRNIPVALQAYEQAAKEMGEHFVNRGRGGDVGEHGEAPLPTVINVGVKDARRPAD